MTREERRCKRHYKRYDETVSYRRVRARKSDNQHLRSLTSHVVHMDRTLRQLVQNFAQRDDIRKEENRVMNKNINKLQRQSYRVLGFRGKGTNGVCGNTNQCSCPHCSHCIKRQQQVAEEAFVIEQQQEEAARTPANLIKSPKKST